MFGVFFSSLLLLCFDDKSVHVYACIRNADTSSYWLLSTIDGNACMCMYVHYHILYCCVYVCVHYGWTESNDIAMSAFNNTHIAMNWRQNYKWHLYTNNYAWTLIISKLIYHLFNGLFAGIWNFEIYFVIFGSRSLKIIPHVLGTVNCPYWKRGKSIEWIIICFSMFLRYLWSGNIWNVPKRISILKINETNLMKTQLMFSYDIKIVYSMILIGFWKFWTE